MDTTLADAAVAAVDPVCGMPVDEGTAARLRHGGKDYLFGVQRDLVKDPICAVIPWGAIEIARDERRKRIVRE